MRSESFCSTKMESLIIFLLFLLIFCSVTVTSLAQQNISLGSSLTPTGNSSWLSPSGLFAYGFYRQGDRYGVGIFVAGIPEKTLVWTANRDTNPTFPSNASLLLTSDGRMLVQQFAESDTIIYEGTESIASASMLDSGNFVLYNARKSIIWQSFDNPTDTMLAGQSLKPDQSLISSASDTDQSKGNFLFIMQTDGNLVMYPTFAVSSNNAYYATMTFGNHTLNLEADGHLYLKNSSSIIMNMNNGGYPSEGRLYLLKIDVDGIVKLYSYSLDHGNRSIIWQSTSDKCAPLGRCGLNSYCTTMDDQMECKCLPGFEFLSPGNWSLGCDRNFTVESCKPESSRVVELPGVVWENTRFSALQNGTSEDCQNACLDDCNCEIAYWGDGVCSMERLPMRFGRRNAGSNQVALIKVGNGIPASSPVDAPSAVVVVEKKTRLYILIVGICLAVIGIMFFVASRIHCGKRYKKIGTDKQNCEFLEGVAPRAFSFEELKQATDDFSHEVGRGAFGTVFKGILMDFEKIIAVKKLENVMSEGEKEFKNEIRAIGKTHHRNLVRFLGYCLDGTNRLLVYEYMSNGSLADFLFNNVDNRIPTWDERIRIAREVARGILYLHQECDTQIIHCDIKPENILLDENRCAKISDFGLAKLLDPDQTRIFTGIRGTKGYVAPEWHRKSAVTVKADVFSFGIVLLEIICCRKSVDFSLADDEAVLEDFSYDCFQNGNLCGLVPAGDQQQVAMSKFERMVKIALWCIQHDPSFRPSMNKVVLMLEGTVDIPIPPCPAENFLSAN